MIPISVDNCITITIINIRCYIKNIVTGQMVRKDLMWIIVDDGKYLIYIFGYQNYF